MTRIILATAALLCLAHHASAQTVGAYVSGNGATSGACIQSGGGGLLVGQSAPCPTVAQYVLTATTTSTSLTTVEGVPCGTTASQLYGYVEVVNIKALDTITGAVAQWAAGPLVFSCTGGTPANAKLSSSVVTAGPNTATTGSSLYGAGLPVISADTSTNKLSVAFTAAGTNSTTWTVYVGAE